MVTQFHKNKQQLLVQWLQRKLLPVGKLVCHSCSYVCYVWSYKFLDTYP